MAKKADRFRGKVITVEFPERPKCKHCGKKMKIFKRTKPRVTVGLQENYELVVTYYRCGKFNCPGNVEDPVRPDFASVPKYSDYDIDVLAKICELRWKHKCTYEEISNQMEQDFGIPISLSTIEIILKIYEIGCAERFKPEYIENIKKFGGIILTIDGMAPLKGKKSLYVAYDHRTGLALGSRLLTTQKREMIAEFLEAVKKRIEEELKVPVLAIISDALVSQRQAVEDVFPDVPHCLCHYHFFELVLKGAKGEDSKITTSIRQALRGAYDLKKYKIERADKGKEAASKGFLGSILETLYQLSNWNRRPKDPCFTGLELFGRIQEMILLLTDASSDIGKDVFTKFEERKIQRLLNVLDGCIVENGSRATELERIKEHLETMSKILGEIDGTKEESLQDLRRFRDKLRRHKNESNCGEIERKFIEEFMKFVRTKGEQLFNYKLVDDAPRTNNSHELRYKQLKHLIRRIIGFSAAKSYLLSHGERIVYVNPSESFDVIVEILLNMDHGKARKDIIEGREPRDALHNIIHDAVGWKRQIEHLRSKLQDLRERKTKRT